MNQDAPDRDRSTARPSAGSVAFLDALRAGPLLCDGAMGTLLAAAAAETAGGAEPIQYLVPEELNERAPERVLAVHRAYVAAGARVLETNSFGGSSIKLAAAGLQHRAWELNARAARLAREAADGRRGDTGTRGHGDTGTRGRGDGDSLSPWERGSPRPRVPASPVWVAGSIGPTGQFLEPLGELSFAAAREVFAAQAAALAEGGADLLLVETVLDLEEARAALLGAREATGLPVVVTLTFEAHGRTMMGVAPEDAVRALADWGAAAVGANCGQGPDMMLPVIQRIRQAVPDLPLVAQANAGQPRLENGVVRYDCGPEEFAAFALGFVDAGVRLLGSCCGSTPAHTAALAAVLAARAGA